MDKTIKRKSNFELIECKMKYLKEKKVGVGEVWWRVDFDYAAEIEYKNSGWLVLSVSTFYYSILGTTNFLLFSINATNHCYSLEPKYRF